MGMADVKICPNGTVGNRCGCAEGEGCNKPAEPVEESARRIRADVIRQAIAAIATLGPISGERWLVELERFAQIVEDKEGSDD